MDALGVITLLVALVVPLGLVALVVYGIWRVARRDDGPGGGGVSEQGVRRFFQYAVLYGLMIVAGVGVSDLLARALGGGTVLIGADEPALARSLTFTIVGLPLFLVLAAWSWRRLRQDPDEGRSLAWSVYSIAAPLTALAFALAALHDLLLAALGAESFAVESVTGLVVWGMLWLAHRVAATPVGDPGVVRVHLAIGATAGLALSAAGVIAVVAATIDSFGDGGAMVTAGSDLAWAAALAATGIPVWALYWLAGLARSPRTGPWYVYVLPVGVGGGLVTAVSAGSVLLHDVLVWFVGDPVPADAARFFDAAPGLAATVATGLLVWWYHRAVLSGTEPEGRIEPRRVYEYLMAAGGLLAAAAGIAAVLVGLVEAAAPGSFVEAAPVNTLLAAVTAIAVGGPLWWVFWRRIERAVSDDPAAEVESPTRRVYLFALFGVGGVVAVVSVLVAVFVFIEALLEGRLGGETLHRMRFALGTLVTAGAVAGYHWTVFRRDRSLAPEKADDEAWPRRVVLVGPADGEIAAALGRATGAKVELWARADGIGAPWSLDGLLAALAGLDGPSAVVVSGEAGIDVVALS